VLKVNKLKLLTILTCALAVMVPAAIASAEDVRELVHAYRVWKLTDVLDLSEEQMPVFYSKIRDIDRMEAEILKDQRRVVQHLRDILDDEKVDEQRLGEALEEHRALRLKRIEEVGRLRDEAETMLSAQQRARYVVFDQEFRSDIRNIIQKARDLERLRRMDERLDMQGSGMGSPGGRTGGSGGSRGRR
jgi:hypothetical protein